MLNATQIQQASLAVRELRVSLSNFFLYSAENAMVKQSLDRFLEVLTRLFDEFPSVSFGESEGRLVVEGAPLDERLTGSTNMIKDLFLTHKIHTLTFDKGVQAPEVHALFSLLRPRALPTGVSLSQALVQQSLGHVHVNEKVFVALSEGEVVVPSDAATGSGQNMQEALEALQYFLQIFSRVRPDTNKQEVARRLMENMGAWLEVPETPGGPGGGEGPGGKGAGAGSNPQPWRDLMGGFLGLKAALASLKTPAQVSDAQVSMDDLLKKLVLLGESQGVALEDPPAAASAPAAAAEASQAAPTSPTSPTSPATPAAPAETVPPEQGSLFETDPVLVAIGKRDWDALLAPELEEKLGEKIPSLQDPDQTETMESLWEKLWEKVFSADEPTQALALRQLSHFQWNRVPRPLQLEGFRNLCRLLKEIRRPANYPIALTLAQDWIPQELASADWTDLLEMTRLLVRAATQTPARFEKQNQAARVALDTVFCEPILESLLNRYPSEPEEGNNTRKLFILLGPRVGPFLFNKIEETQTGSSTWLKALDLLEAQQKEGQHVYETWLGWPEKRAQLEKFLDIFVAVPPTGELEDYFERHWNTFSPLAQGKILASARQWKKQGFRPFLMRLLEKPEAPIALEALETLAAVGLEGDGEAIVKAVKDYPPHGKEREKFWVKACEALGRLADTPATTHLMDWAGKYKFMERKMGRSLEVRRAAIQALGHSRSATVWDFLGSLRGEVEKELKPDVDESWKSVGARLSLKDGLPDA